MNGYFPHDENARNDQKLLKLRAKYGLEGYGLFWCILETMATDSTGYIAQDDQAMAGLSLSYGMETEKLKERINFMIDVGIFKSCEHGNLYSDRMQSHIAFRRERSESGRKGAFSRWNRQNNDSANASAIKQPMASKGKERKDKSIGNILPLDSVLPDHNLIEQDIPTEKKQPAYRPECRFISEYLIKCLEKTGMQPRKDEPTLLKWDKEVHLMVARDNRTFDGIKTMIDECMAHEGSNGFTWSKNIRSTGTLRHRWNENKIWLGMNTKKIIKRDTQGREIVQLTETEAKERGII